MFRLSSLADGTVNYIRRLGLNAVNTFTVSKMPGKYTCGMLSNYGEAGGVQCAASNFTRTEAG